MRLSTADAFDSGLGSLTKKQSELAKLQEQISSQLRVQRASDDPAAAARAERALAGIARSETSQRAVDASRTAMTQTESALGDASNLLQDAREAIVASGNASYSDAERKFVSNQIKEIRNQLLTVANRTDGSGGYLFAGQSAAQQPFTDSPGGVRYTATPGQTSAAAVEGMHLTDNGSATWLSSRTGNGTFVTTAGAMVKGATINNGRVVDPAAVTGDTYSLQFTVAAGVTTYAILQGVPPAPTATTAAPYTSGKEILLDGMSFSIEGTPAQGDQFDVTPSTSTLSVFDALDQAIAGLATPRLTGPQVAQTVADNLRNVDSVMANMQSARAAAGELLHRIDNETTRIGSQKLAQETEQSDATALDLMSAYSTYQTKQAGYDAALKSYSTVQRMSLFTYLQG